MIDRARSSGHWRTTNTRLALLIAILVIVAAVTGIPKLKFTIEINSYFNQDIVGLSLHHGRYYNDTLKQTLTLSVESLIGAGHFAGNFVAKIQREAGQRGTKIP